MDDFFTDEPADTLAQHPPAAFDSHFHQESTVSYPQEPFAYQPTQVTHQDQDDFGPPEEDEVTRRIRQEEEALNNRLAAKSNEEYELKMQRREEGRRQMQEYLASKERELQQRKRENLQTQQRQVRQLKQLSSVGGWQKVLANITTKQGEHPGKKDISRMREAILHRRDDEKQ